MRLCFTSDFHGCLPEIENCDILFICGDICPFWNHDILYQKLWLGTEFSNWVWELHDRNIKILLIAGNHDNIFEKTPLLIPKLPVYYLENSGVELNGLKIWGSPYSTKFGNWSFMDTNTNLTKIWKKIPENTDILLTHGPPYGILDWTVYGNEHAGSQSLKDRVFEIKPKIHAFGHIHEGNGVYNSDGVMFINASHMNIYYKAVNKPYYLELENLGV